MYGLFTCIWLIFMVIVGIDTIHGWYGIWSLNIFVHMAMDYGAMYMICHPCEKGSDKALTSIQYIYILYTYILASCQNYAHPLPPPPKKQPTTSFFCLAGPCQKMFGHDGWMFGKLLTWWMNVIPKGPGMSFATFEVQRFRHGGLRLGLASEEFPEREKGRKGLKLRGFFEFCWGNLLGGPFWETLGGISVWG